VTIEVTRPLVPELCYHVLSHLDLGRDAASMFRRRDEPRSAWVEPLRHAYLAAPGRLSIHVAPLGCRDLDALRDALARVAIGGLDGALRAALLAAVQAEWEGVERRWRDGAAEGAARAVAIGALLRHRLQPLREHLWSGLGQLAPPLEVLDCDALLSAPFTFGRGATVRGRRLVAVSLAADAEHVLLQILHEEIHPVSDPAVTGPRRGAARDTRARSEGYGLHIELERVAVELGWALLEARDPALLPAYRRWCEQWA
jgi:hypothetical protein